MTKIEPIYQLQSADGRWIDQEKHSYDYNVKHGHAVVRIVYHEEQMRQLADACAEMVETGFSTDAEYAYGKEIGALLRELVKEMLG